MSEASMAEKALFHTNKMNKKFSKEIIECIKNTKIYSCAYKDKSKEPFKVFGEIIDMDSVSAIFYIRKKYPGMKVGVLNFASFKNPGGQFINGSTAQEECLCFESFLYNVLIAFDSTYYAYNRQNKNKALYLDRGLYSPNVIFTRGEEQTDCNVITCAAPNYGAAMRYCNVSREENNTVLANRIDFVLNIFEKEKIDIPILGAFGCGVFKQDAKEVAEIFKELLPKYNFKKVYFAIPTFGKPYNYNKFIEVFYGE